jgi:secondary thiamine-phosphate synthase enzyme
VAPRGPADAAFRARPSARAAPGPSPAGRRNAKGAFGVPAFCVDTSARRQLVDVTAQLAEACSAQAGAAGALLVSVPHTTAGITVNEGYDPDVANDLLAALAALVPAVRFRHSEGNSDAHLQAALVGSSVVVPLEGGRLALGRWQRVFLCEFDGPRRRQVWLRFLAGA